MCVRARSCSEVSNVHRNNSNSRGLGAAYDLFDVCIVEAREILEAGYGSQELGAGKISPRLLRPGARPGIPMTLNGWLQIVVFIAIIIAIAKPVGLFMTHVFNGERTFLHFVLHPVERMIYRLTGVNQKKEMHWTEYAGAMLLYSLVSMLLLFLMQRLQGHLPFNPQHLPGVDSAGSATAGYVASAFNTAASFTTNTNWQSYVPEVTMSYLTQMAGLAYHNFGSASVGIVLAIAFIRGIARKEMLTIGNFWVDFVRCNLYVLLPVCVIGALLLVSQGVVQNLRPYDTAKLVEPQTVQVEKKDANGNVLTNPDGTNQQETQTVTEQTIAQGPVA